MPKSEVLKSKDPSPKREAKPATRSSTAVPGKGAGQTVTQQADLKLFIVRRIRVPLRSAAIDREASDPRRRAIFVALGLVAWMVIVGVRLAQLQIGQHDELSTRAKNQQLGAVETSPTRGLLLDRQGRELARSVDTESFFADPREIENVNETARKIASVTNQIRTS
jgi:hypothetical protein